MKSTDIKTLLKSAVTRFLDVDADLLRAEANERSITHKFAECLQSIVGYAWNVDCEYNRYGDEAKNIISEIVPLVGGTVSTSEIKSKTVYPDIIVHKRGITGPNLLVIEAKKDATSAERDADSKKLRKIMQLYDYKYAVFLNFITGIKPDVIVEFIPSEIGKFSDGIRP
jgi:hypothetical protein